MLSDQQIYDFHTLFRTLNTSTSRSKGEDAMHVYNLYKTQRNYAIKRQFVLDVKELSRSHGEGVFSKKPRWYAFYYLTHVLNRAMVADRL